jgi:hypothetical protein
MMLAQVFLAALDILEILLTSLSIKEICCWARSWIDMTAIRYGTLDLDLESDDEQ